MADRRGDIYNLQGKKTEARNEYLAAWQGLEDQVEYRRLVEVKLTALGVAQVFTPGATTQSIVAWVREHVGEAASA